MYKGNIKIDTKTMGGVFQTVTRSLFGGESIFFNTFTALEKSEVYLAPSLPGDIAYIPLNNDSYIVYDGAYLAHHGNVEISVKWRGLKGFIAGRQLVWLNFKGTGGVFINTFGAIKVVEVGNETIIIDNLHFVAMKESTEYSIEKFGSWKSFLFGGEGVVLKIYGPTKVFIQTRNLSTFSSYFVYKK